MTVPIADYHGLVRNDVIERVSGPLGRVLDFGGGIGATSAFLKAAGRADRVVLADLVEGDRPAEIDVTVTGDLNDLALVERLVTEHGPFDTILALDVFEHLYDPWAVAQLLARGLSSNGQLVASIPNVNCVGIVGPLVLAGKWELQDSGLLDRTHIRWFTGKTAQQLLEQADLKIDIIDDTIMPSKYSILNRVTFGILKRFFVVQYLLIARPDSKGSRW